MAPPAKPKGLMERIKKGETVLVAEGYLFEMERRGYLKAGPFVPEVVLEHSELVEQITDEFVHAGSDVCLAFTYYGHREKLRLIGRENQLEELNREAVRIAKKVADKTGTLTAGNICNTTCYDPNDPKTHDEARKIFKEEVEWAIKGGADFILGETYSDLGEAKLALEVAKQYGNGLPVVICFAPNTAYTTRDGFTYDVACKQLEDLGCDVVGLNCGFGPKTIIPEMRKIRAACKGPIACLPVPYRTTYEQPQMQSLTIPYTGERAFFENLDYFTCPVDDIVEFGKACKEIGIQYVGLCCGNTSRYFRKLAETLGRKPAASRYSTDMSLHYVYGDQKHFRSCNTNTLRGLNTPTDVKQHK